MKTRWLSPRRKRFWAVIVILLYAVLGFFVAPALIENQVTRLFQDDLGRPVQIEKTEVNPFALSLRVRGFEVDDTDGVKLAAFDEFYINFQLSSLFHWAWTFGEIRLASPYLYFERFKSGDTRIGRLLADFEEKFPAENSETPKEGGAPRLLIHDLAISEGRVEVLDNVPGTAVETQLAPINIAMQEINTLPDRNGMHSVAIRLPNDASLSWSGSLTLVPFNSEGELVMEGLHLDQLTAYLESVLPIDSFSAVLSGRLNYRLYQDENAGMGVEVNGLEMELADLLVSGLSPQTDFMEIPKITLRGGQLRYPEQRLHIDEINVENPKLAAWMNENGSLSLMDLVPPVEEGDETADTGTESSPWQLGIEEFVLDGGSLAFSDRSIEPNAEVGLTQLRVKLSDISNADDAEMPYEIAGQLEGGGSFTSNGSVALLPGLSLTATTGVHDLPLSLGQPYFQQYVRVEVEGGKLDSDLDISMPAGEPFTATGALQVSNLEIDDSLEHQRLLGWESLKVDRGVLNAEGVNLSLVTFSHPYARMVVHEDKTTNLSDLLVEQPAGGDRDSGAAEKSANIIIGGVQVDGGAMDFSDFSLPLPFSTHITSLDGTVSTIATNSATPADISLEGQVDEYGLARIGGNMNMLDPIQHMNVTVEFRNLLMSSLSPYTVQFAGRKIDEGKLDLGLVYAIDEGQLHGSNDVVLSDLVLGEKVDYPDAGSLPLGLAVSLLKDANGVIKMDLPVDGDVNDPEFRIGGVIWQAFAGLITKVVSAPFRLLGNLIGVDSEDFGQFEFLAGRADLTPPEMEKIAQLEEALLKRPELKIEVSGVSDRGIDVPALQSMRLRKAAGERLGGDLEEEDRSAMMLDAKIRAVVEAMFVERFPDIPLDSLKTAHMAPPEGNPEGKPVLDELAYANGLWTELLASEVISDQDLTNLANARAEVIRTAFMASGQFDEGRVVISDPKEVESEDNVWVPLELGVAAD